MRTDPTALIAEDEPVLAQALHRELQALWPDLHLLATASCGLQAAALALQHRPDVLFFDIRMPGQSGLDAAAQLADAWPQGEAFPLLVFVTAHGDHALQAFDAHAVDYLLKPVRTERLAHTVARLQSALAQRQTNAQAQPLEPVLNQLRALLATPLHTPPQAHLHMLQASVGKQLRMVPVADVLWMEAADKYVRVFTQDGAEVLLRTPLKELWARLDAQVFWQIHRSTVVRASAIASVTRDDSGRCHVHLKGLAQALPVSRIFAHQFKAM